MSTLTITSTIKRSHSETSVVNGSDQQEKINRAAQISALSVQTLTSFNPPHQEVTSSTNRSSPSAASMEVAELTSSSSFARASTAATSPSSSVKLCERSPSKDSPLLPLEARGLGLKLKVKIPELGQNLSTLKQTLLTYKSRLEEAIKELKATETDIDVTENEIAAYAKIKNIDQATAEDKEVAEQCLQAYIKQAQELTQEIKILEIKIPYIGNFLLRSETPPVFSVTARISPVSLMSRGSSNGTKGKANRPQSPYSNPSSPLSHQLSDRVAKTDETLQTSSST